MSEPARGYSWPPFAVGNTVARKHGTWAADVDYELLGVEAQLAKDRPRHRARFTAIVPRNVTNRAAAARCHAVGTHAVIALSSPKRRRSVRPDQAGDLEGNPEPDRPLPRFGPMPARPRAQS